VDISPGIPLQIGWHNTAPDRRVCVCVCVGQGEGYEWPHCDSESESKYGSTPVRMG